jgi:hypothetical protein
MIKQLKENRFHSIEAMREKGREKLRERESDERAEDQQIEQMTNFQC